MNQPDEPADVATFRIAYKNILGSNWTRWTFPWFSRAPRIKRELLGEDGMRASVYFLGEVNRRPQRRSLRRMLRGWDIVLSEGCNNAYSDAKKHRIVTQREFPLSSDSPIARFVTIVTYEHVATGITWTAATSHLTSSGGGSQAVARKNRAMEARVLVDLCAKYDVDVIAADLNNSAHYPESVRSILEAAGFIDWRHATQVANAEYNTFHAIAQMPLRRHTHIDAIYLGARVTATSGRVQITEPDSSDHFGLVCTISVRR
jgi:hypothetical protein